MRFASLAVFLVVSLAGCMGDQSPLLAYFPPASTLPDGVHPLAVDDPVFRAAQAYMKIDGNPGRVKGAESMPAEDARGGNATMVEMYMWWLRDTTNGTAGEATFMVVVMRYESRPGGSLVGSAGENPCTDGKERLLRDGLISIMVWGDGAGGAGRTQSVLDAIAESIHQRTGAALVC